MGTVLFIFLTGQSNIIVCPILVYTIDSPSLKCLVLCWIDRLNKLLVL